MLLCNSECYNMLAITTIKAIYFTNINIKSFMKVLFKVENNKYTEIANLNCNDFEIELLDKVLLKLSKVETKHNRLVGNDNEIKYVITDKPSYNYDQIKDKLEHMVTNAVKTYNDKVDLINVITKRVNKKLGRPINESLISHYE